VSTPLNAIIAVACNADVNVGDVYDAGSPPGDTRYQTDELMPVVDANCPRSHPVGSAVGLVALFPTTCHTRTSPATTPAGTLQEMLVTDVDDAALVGVPRNAIGTGQAVDT
jgi:hypothetical protein